MEGPARRVRDRERRAPSASRCSAGAAAASHVRRLRVEPASSTSSRAGGDQCRMNRLADETSPYLLQHADNPVDWYPWGEEALARARAEDRPILLSIGYAACHWCHVMEHESFEDEETARADERALRQRQGRPRGAARPRRALHGRGRRADRAGRLADDRLPHARTASRSSAARTSRPSRATGCRFRAGAAWRSPRRTASGATRSRGRPRSSSSASARSRELRPSTGAAQRRRCSREARARHARAASTRSWGGFGARRSSRPPRRSSSCCARRRGATMVAHDARRRWPRAACTTSSAAASTATRSTSAGSCRTSRRCSTTTRCSPPRTCTRWLVTGDERYREVAEETLEYVLRELRARRTAASPRRRTPTPTASRG